MALRTPRALAAAKQVDEALDLAKRLQDLLAEFELGLDAATLLAEAGRREEALAQVEKDLSETDEPRGIARAADALKILGEKTRAQALYRKAQALSDDVEETIGFIEREIPLLEELGRAEEVKALREALEGLKAVNPYADEALEDEEDLDDEEFVPEPLKAEPGPARNAPCPCGSGKKYKKCCGQAR